MTKFFPDSIGTLHSDVLHFVRRDPVLKA